MSHFAAGTDHLEDDASRRASERSRADAGGRNSSEHGRRRGVAPPELSIVQAGSLGGGVSGLARRAITSEDPAKQACSLPNDGPPSSAVGTTADEHNGQRSQTDKAKASELPATDCVLTIVAVGSVTRWMQTI
ncbi:hypothetical protein [Rhodopseudomonas parapalustris]